MISRRFSTIVLFLLVIARLSLAQQETTTGAHNLYACWVLAAWHVDIMKYMSMYSYLMCTIVYLIEGSSLS